MTHVMRHAKPMKGRAVVGYAPLAGAPLDGEGRLILDWVYAATGAADVTAPAVVEAPPAARLKPSRGVQASLL